MTRTRAIAGERCALNVTGADVADIHRGDWVVAPAIHAPKQRLDFSFVMDLQGKERRLQTYGVVLTNDSRGLDIRYRPPTAQWRGILTKLLTDENTR